MLGDARLASETWGEAPPLSGFSPARPVAAGALSATARPPFTTATTGFDVGKTVTRVAVVVDPGQKRTVTATVVVDDAADAAGATSLTQPMVRTATTTVGAVPACSRS